LIAECVWTTNANITAISTIIVRFGVPRIASICSTEYLQGLKEGGKRDLETGEIGADGLIVRWIRFGKVAIERGKEGLFNEYSA